jgi:hypothetical protein
MCGQGCATSISDSSLYLSVFPRPSTAQIVLTVLCQQYARVTVWLFGHLDALSCVFAHSLVWFCTQPCVFLAFGAGWFGRLLLGSLGLFDSVRRQEVGQ